MTDIFDSAPHLEPYTVLPSDLKVFDPARARFARPKTKEEIEELHDVDNSDRIRKQMEKSAGKLTKPKSDD
jgi:hypothetical protein